MSDAATRKAAVEQYVAAHTAGDIDGIVSIFAPDARVEDPVGSDPHVGTDALRAFFVGTHQLADSFELVLTGPVRVVADHAAFPMQVRTKVGDMSIEIDIIDVFTFDDTDRVVDMKAYWSMEDARIS